MDGLTTTQSEFGPAETMDRLEAELRRLGMQVFARIDHSAGAAEAGLELRPTELIIFGNAKTGTPLMQLDQTMGIDLPLKALVWEDAARQTWISYDEPKWLVQRHGIANQTSQSTELMAAALKAASTVASHAS